MLSVCSNVHIYSHTLSVQDISVTSSMLFLLFFDLVLVACFSTIHNGWFMQHVVSYISDLMLFPNVIYITLFFNINSHCRIKIIDPNYL